MNRVVHFEIHASNMEASKKFYSEVFGWNMQQMGAEYGDYVVVQTGPNMPTGKMEDMGINGGMTLRKGAIPESGQPVNAFVCIIAVDNIDAYIEKAKAAGGTIALEKMEVPKVGLLVYFKDPDNNLFGMLQPDMSGMHPEQ